MRTACGKAHVDESMQEAVIERALQIRYEVDAMYTTADKYQKLKIRSLCVIAACDELCIEHRSLTKTEKEQLKQVTLAAKQSTSASVDYQVSAYAETAPGAASASSFD
eukprot:2219093-Pleurochrysis_carterae.AAC.1